MTSELKNVIIDSMLCIGGLYVSEDLIFNIRLAYFALEKEKNIYFEKQNLTASQGDLLLYLGFADRQGKEVNQKDIEQYFRLTNPTITGLLNRLEDKGFVERKKSPTDGRTNLIYLTDQTKKVLDQFKQHKDSIDQKLYRDFSDDERRQIIYLLKKLRTNLNTDELR